MRIFALSGVLLMLASAASAQGTADAAALNRALKINPASAAALAELEALAEGGDSKAALFASSAYRGGFGAERDFDRATALAVRAAELGNAAGLLAQGDIIRQAGRGSAESVAAARPFWDQAAALGNVGALGRLAQVDAPALVSQLQRALDAKGFDAGAADGVIGPKTLSAVNAYCAEAEISDACAEGELTSAPVLRALVRSGLLKSN